MIEKVLGRFVLPEKDLTLKLVFDNARNYVIVGGFVAMARWFELGKATPVPYMFTGPPKTGWGELMWVSLSIALVLYLLNLSQSYLIVKRLWKLILGIPDEAQRATTRSKPAWYIRLVIRLIAMTLTSVIILTSLLLLIISTYIVWYAVPEAVR